MGCELGKTEVSGIVSILLPGGQFHARCKILRYRLLGQINSVLKAANWLSNTSIWYLSPSGSVCPGLSRLAHRSIRDFPGLSGQDSESVQDRQPSRSVHFHPSGMKKKKPAKKRCSKKDVKRKKRLPVTSQSVRGNTVTRIRQSGLAA